MAEVFNKTSPDVIAEIQRRYLAGEKRHQIAKDLHMGQGTVFKYCEEVYLPGSKAPLSNNTISGLMMTWK